MTEHQIHYDKKFYKDKQTGYWISTLRPKIRAHVWVWNQNHGEVPKGYHVHHRDEDKSNNSIENLTILTHIDHAKAHMTEDRVAFCRQNLNKIRPMTKAWHASEEGREWHTQHGIDGWNNRKPIEITCKVCSERFTTKAYHKDFCSNKCKSKWRRDSGLDDIDIVCKNCQNSFKSNKYSKVIFCSKTCAQRYRAKYSVTR